MYSSKNRIKFVATVGTNIFEVCSNEIYHSELLLVCLVMCCQRDLIKKRNNFTDCADFGSI